MKKLQLCFVLVFVLIICSALPLSAQKKSDKSELDALALQILENTNNKDYSKLLDLTYPVVFDIVSRESMLLGIKSILEGNNETSVKIHELAPEYRLSQIFYNKAHNINYSFMAYDMKMSMTFYNQTFDDQGREFMVKIMANRGMEAKFRSDSVMDVKMKNQITIFINDEFTKGEWKSVNYDKSTNFISQVLPDFVLTAADTYLQKLNTEQND